MSENVVNKKVELTAEQEQRITEVHEAALIFCRKLTGWSNLEWNMRFIRPIVDFAAQTMVSEGIPVYYPSVITEDGGERRVQEYVNDLVDYDNDNDDRLPF